MEKSIENIDNFIFIENKESNKLIVSFNHHNGANNFFKYGTLTKNNKYNLLFITNENNWYLDGDGKGDYYKKFLTEYVNKFKPENILFFGSSMGAYGALIHGIHFGVNIFASNPQISEQIVFKYEIPEKKNFANSLLKKNIKLLDMKEIYGDNKTNPIIHLLYGDTPCDVENLKHFLTYIPSKVKMVIEKLPIRDHNYWTHPENDLVCRLEIMQKMRQMTYSTYK